MSRVPKIAALMLIALAGAGGAQPQSQPQDGTPPPADIAPIPADLVRSVRGLVPDQQLECIRIMDATDPSSAENTILWRAGRHLYYRNYYRNDTKGGCAGLNWGDTIVTERLGGDRLCRGDIVRTVNPTSRTMTGSCTLGPFTRYARPGTRPD